SALVTTGVLVMLFSLNGLLLTEILASLFGGFFVSEAGRQKAVKLVTKIKSDAVENLRNRIEIIFFEEFIKVQDNIGEKISNMQPLMEAMTSKGEIEMLREQIGEIIAES
ncbi:hypothetical protein KAJ27_19055, partial [bacterium]|nr:hypothetical protein [bacterium]